MTMMTQDIESGAVPPDRVVPLTGGHNFRDIGGYATTDGRMTAWRRIYRSGTMAELNETDHAILNDLGLRVICDFRTTEERTRRPSRLPAAESFEIWARDYDHSGANLIDVMRRPGATVASSREQLIKLYHTLAYEQAPALRELFLRIAQGPLPLVFHCAAGKDRTGVAAALLLDLLSVPRDTILEDYTLTDRFFERGCRLVREDPIGNRLADVDPQIWQPMMRADPAYLASMFDTLEKRHGSARDFLREEIGVDKDMGETIRERLLV